MNIAVYLGSSFGNDPSFKEVTAEVGTRIAREGHTLIYGGSAMGLMGVLADSALAEGGEVIGVEPQFFLDEGLEHPGITRTIPTETMAERKTIMMDMADAYVALPGGIGTLDEISEVAALAAIDRHGKPCVIFNKNGYYDLLGQFLDKMVTDGLLIPEGRERIRFVESTDEMMDAIAGSGADPERR